MNRREFTAGGLLCSLATPLWAECPKEASWQQCDSVPDNAFRHGTVNRVPDCVLEFLLPSELLTHEGIVLDDGTYEWTLRLITLDRSGRPKWQQAHRVVNQPSKRQGVYFGTTVATYITCDLLTGWYSTGPIRSCQQPVFRKVDWPFDWKQLERMAS